MVKTPITVLESMYFFRLVSDHLPFSGKERVLEIGVGSGYGCFVASKFASQVVGVDISQPLIHFLQEFAKKKGFQNTFFLHLDFCQSNLKLGYGPFDFAFSSDVLEHVESPSGMLENLHQNLKSSGKCVMTFPNSKTHGRKFYSDAKDIFALFPENKWKSKVFKVHPSGLYSFVWDYLYMPARSVYKKLTGAKKDVDYKKDEDVFHHFACFEIIKKPTVTNQFIGLLVKGLFWLCSCVELYSLQELRAGENMEQLRLLAVLEKI